ncbi:hypothetical protein GF412_03800 [Candidatus Micrarchaeota archaeon]|nr:hypothetical protein [Candidatus Micrarchaeota archaeon]MBD3418074.1 hypothetical protein [Candidatus Micrarchaeota archaeon]
MKGKIVLLLTIVLFSISFADVNFGGTSLTLEKPINGTCRAQYVECLEDACIGSGGEVWTSETETQYRIGCSLKSQNVVEMALFDEEHEGAVAECQTQYTGCIVQGNGDPGEGGGICATSLLFLMVPVGILAKG